MNKTSQITHYNQLLKAAQDMQAVAMQNFSLAARLEGEAKSALEGLGVQPGQARKGKYEIPQDIKMRLQARMTKKPK